MGGKPQSIGPITITISDFILNGLFSEFFDSLSAGRMSIKSISVLEIIQYCLFTGRNSSCEKGMFLRVSVCQQGGVSGRWGMCGKRGVRAEETATEAGGPHPTGMHSRFGCPP